jgi:phosphate transport system protein
MRREVDALKGMILSVGAMVESAIVKSVDAIMKRDLALAQEVSREDNKIDLMEVEVEEECLKILALYQPVAIDLRFVIAVLKMNNDLERMGDLAANIAGRAEALINQPPVELPPDFGKMATQCMRMVKRSLDSLVNSDVQLAYEVCAEDDKLDELQLTTIEWLHNEMRKDPSKIQQFINLFSASRHLERLGDMATNIAEDVIYMVEGIIIRHKGPIAVPKKRAGRS